MPEDKEIRELLENASVKAPRGAWEKISGRLDDIGGVAPAAAGRRFPGFGIVASVCLAGVAAAVACLLFIGRGGSVSPVSPSATSPVGIAVQAEEREDARSGILTPIGSNAPLACAGATAVSSPVRTGISASSSCCELEEVGGKSEDEAELEEAQKLGKESEDAAELEEIQEERREETEGGRLLCEIPDFEDGESRTSGSSIQLDGMAGANAFNFISRSASHIPAYSPGAGSLSTGISEESESAYGLPLSFGVSVRFEVLPRFSIGAGVSYSLLTRTFQGTYTRVENDIVVRKSSGDVRNTMHYVGIPVTLYYRLVEKGIFRLNVKGGGSVEYCVSNRYSLGDEFLMREPVDAPQFSAFVGLGVEFILGKQVSLFLDPQASFYFGNRQPKSIRTDMPFLGNIDAGIRFSL